MFEFRKRKTAVRFMYSPWTLAVMAIALVFFIRAAWNVHEKEVISREALDRTTRELEKLTERQSGLANSVSFLGTPQGVETEIRQKFRVAKDGESVAVILEDSITSVATSTPGGWSFWGWLTGLFGMK